MWTDCKHKQDGHDTGTQVKLALERAMKAYRVSSGISLLFL